MRYYVGQISSDAGQRVIYKESATSLAWSPEPVVDNTMGNTDKNHLWVDNNTTGTGAGFLYSAWSNDTWRVEVMRKTANASSWGQRQNVDANDLRAEWGVNLKVGLSSSYRNHVYAVWGETASQQWTDRIIALWFNKSTNVDLFTWGSQTQVVSLPNIRGYTVREGLSGKSMGANSAPSMTVDASGNIYVVWGQKRRDGTSSVGEIYLVKSTDEGATWSPPLRVNQDTGTADQWLPWVTWDDCTNAIVVAYFDSRLPAPPDPLHNSKVDTYIAVSYDGGATFPSANEKRVSDVSWSGDCSPAGRAGDYLGVAARDGIAYPVWSDDREAADGQTFKVYVSPIYLWGPVQSSISHTISSIPGLGLSVDISWVTDLPATCGDVLLLTAPSGATQVFAGPCDICKLNLNRTGFSGASVT